MQTHPDRDYLNSEWWNRLQERADKAVKTGASQITSGMPDEKPLEEWKAVSVNVMRMPDDEQGILRISVGGGIGGLDMNYCVYRGDRRRCLNLLRQAVTALEKRPH